MRARYFFFVVLLIACVVSVSSIHKVFVEKSEYLEHYRGDFGAQLNTYTAGLNFSRHGFAKLYFLPAIARYEDSYEALQKQRLYTHYPPGPELVSGCLQTLGIHGIYQQRAVLLSFNLIELLLLAFAIRRMLPEARAAAPLILISMIITSAWFIWWCGNLQESVYLDLFLALGTWAAAERKERLFLFTCFFAMLFTFEPAPWLTVVGVFMATQNVSANAWSKIRALRFLVIMMASFVLAFGIHLIQNACYFHSFSAAIDDLLGSYLSRIGAVSATAATQYSVAKHITKAAYGILWFYGTGVLVLAGLGLRASIKKRVWLPVVLLAAGFVWQIAFRQHSMAHAYLWRHIGIGLFVLATVGFLNLWEQAAWKKCVAVILLFMALFRVPLGCDVSNNPVLLRQLQSVVRNTDSSTIAELLYFLRDNPEHMREKAILINELAVRNHAPPDQPAYMIEWNETSFGMRRDKPGHSIRYRNFPEDRMPLFHDTVFPYLDPAGARNKPPPELYKVELPVETGEASPIRLAANGKPNAMRYRLLLGYLLLQ